MFFASALSWPLSLDRRLDKHGILAKREDLMFGNNFKSDLKELSELKKEASKMAEALGTEGLC
jgi:hypothetical protein